MTERQLKSQLKRSEQYRINKGNRGSIDVLEVFGYNDEQLWYDIPNFPAYQISNKEYVRSFKCRKQHPLGVILKPRKTSNGIVYELTDRNNFVRTIGLDQIKNIVAQEKDDPYYTHEVPRNTQSPQSQMRNKRAFINPSDSIPEDVFGTIKKKPRPIRKESSEIYHFSVIPDEEEKIRKIVKPIRIEGENESEFYY